MNIFNKSGINPNADRSGVVCWRSPSNIAFVKYWGKKEGQIPANPSISMTLNKCYTELTCYYAIDYSLERPEVELSFEGKLNSKFQMRVESYLDSIVERLPFLKFLSLKIVSTNSFPHSAGIASSASSMSALALCLCSLEERLTGIKNSREDFFKKASILARLASGSACRSVYGDYVIWGEHDQVPSTSDQFAIPLTLNQLDIKFHKLGDTVLLVDSSPKPVSSSAGHGLMNGHPMAEGKYQSGRDNLKKIVKAMTDGDWQIFGTILEQESMALHAMMMSSTPSVILLKPNSLEIIARVHKFRESSGLPLYFTIDAGPNIHLIYPQSIKVQVDQFVVNQLASLCENGSWIDDEIGGGPEEIKKIE